MIERARSGRSPWVRRFAGVWCLAALMAGCGESADEDESGGTDNTSLASGAECPEDSTVTWENFGEAFFTTYCTPCHSTELTGNARHGAPRGHDYDTLQATINSSLIHTDEVAASGPLRTNARMPPRTAEAQPTEVERARLGEWLACGAP